MVTAATTCAERFAMRSTMIASNSVTVSAISGVKNVRS